MTIYKFILSEKKPEDNVEASEVIADLLKADTEKKEVPMVAVSMTEVIRRRRLLLHLLIVLAILIFLVTAAVGGVFLYRYFTRISVRIDPNHEPLVYGVNYYDDPVEEVKSKVPVHYVEERIQLFEVEGFEKIEVPSFDECESSLVVHDFINNYTAIVDKSQTRCFVLKLNRTQVVPPRDVIDLVKKLWTGHYTPKVRTLREKYMVFPEPVTDVFTFGKFVGEECKQYTTFRLVKYRQFFKKLMGMARRRVFGYYPFRESVIKIEVSM